MFSPISLPNTSLKTHNELVSKLFDEGLTLLEITQIHNFVGTLPLIKVLFKTTFFKYLFPKVYSSMSGVYTAGQRLEIKFPIRVPHYVPEFNENNLEFDLNYIRHVHTDKDIKATYIPLSGTYIARRQIDRATGKVTIVKIPAIISHYMHYYNHGFLFRIYVLNEMTTLVFTNDRSEKILNVRKLAVHVETDRNNLGLAIRACYRIKQEIMDNFKVFKPIDYVFRTSLYQQQLRIRKNHADLSPSVNSLNVWYRSVALNDTTFTAEVELLLKQIKKPS
jgi:hypothetical protein